MVIAPFVAYVGDSVLSEYITQVAVNKSLSLGRDLAALGTTDIPTIKI